MGRLCGLWQSSFDIRKEHSHREHRACILISASLKSLPTAALFSIGVNDRVSRSDFSVGLNFILRCLTEGVLDAMAVEAAVEEDSEDAAAEEATEEAAAEEATEKVVTDLAVAVAAAVEVMGAAKVAATIAFRAVEIEKKEDSLMGIIAATTTTLAETILRCGPAFKSRTEAG